MSLNTRGRGPIDWIGALEAFCVWAIIVLVALSFVLK